MTASLTEDEARGIFGSFAEVADGARPGEGTCPEE
jgi:hypothetical protein